MHNLSATLPLLQSLKDLGVSISIDDFGTGYSSLSYLKRLPIDTLKIDRSFVREQETSTDSAAIVAAIIAMSKSLKLRVVAEGVETQGQMTRLFDQGCQLMQGFLPPAVPGDDFPSMLKASTSQSQWRIDFGPRARNKSADDVQDGPDGHSNGQHFGALESGVVGPPRPSAEQQSTARQAEQPGEQPNQKTAHCAGQTGLSVRDS